MPDLKKQIQVDKAALVMCEESSVFSKDGISNEVLEGSRARVLMRQNDYIIELLENLSDDNRDALARRAIAGPG